VPYGSFSEITIIYSERAVVSRLKVFSSGDPLFGMAEPKGRRAVSRLGILLAVAREPRRC
jgi:hypothetical protein